MGRAPNDAVANGLLHPTEPARADPNQAAGERPNERPTSKKTVPISDRFQTLFIHIPKNAGTSLEQALIARETGHRPWTHYEQEHNNEWVHYTSFAVIRDPIERFISSYNYARMEKSFWHSSIPGDTSIYGKHPDYDVCKSMTINEVANLLANDAGALQHPGWMPQFIWIDNNGSIATKYLANFSKLEQAIKQLAPGADMKHINRSKQLEATEINNSGKAAIERLYRRDIELANKLRNSGKALVSAQEMQ